MERCVLAVEEGLGDNVGGVWSIVPGGTGVIARGIAAAAAHPLGAGDALYRLGATARAVDTVPFGAFRRDLLARVGGFDEKLLTNEDYEFNFRIRQAGGRVWLEPRIRSEYVARATLPELAASTGAMASGNTECWFAIRAAYAGGRPCLPCSWPRSWAWASWPLFWSPARLALMLVVALYVAALVVAAFDMAMRRRRREASAQRHGSAGNDALCMGRGIPLEHPEARGEA